MRKTPLPPGMGWWVRFSKYAVVGGYIRPARDATLQRFRLGADLKDAEGRRPYESLADILDQGRFADGRRGITPETEPLLLRWCERFGLLGLLLQRVETVVFPPQSIPGENQRWAGTGQTVLMRTPSGWQQNSDGRLGPDAARYPWSEPGVMLHDAANFELRWEPIARTWGRFFPSVLEEERSTYSYPHPHDDEFFRLYAEPVEDFLKAGGEFAEALGQVARAKIQPSPDFTPLGSFSQAIRILNGFAATTRRVFRVNPDGSVAELWVPPTLLAALAGMALRDLAVGHAVRLCENVTCRTLFVSKAYGARYCSERCRHTVNKRAVRKNARDKRAEENRRRTRRAAVRRGTK